MELAKLDIQTPYPVCPLGRVAVPVRPSLNVSLTSELSAYVGGRVASGRYRSASEVVRAALRLLQREEPADGVAPAKEKGASPTVSNHD